ncbi:hypothetical protein NHQ30_003457 [Ciborinia camelliae]|nr:hypothetical protein NHQ30_003457 [Ciborinia camelliae]
MTTLPRTYKALRFSTLAGPLTIEEQDTSSIQTPQTLLIKVHYASINPVDTQLWRAGIVSVVSGSKGMGRDFSGTIVGIGDRVKGNWCVGDEVFGLLFQVFGQGTFSQYIAVDPSSDPVVKKPNCLSHEAAASIPLVTLTMFAALEWLPASKRDGERKVIVRGASGGCGSWAVQYYVKSLGADEIIDYTTQPVLQKLLESKNASSTAFDLLIDCVGGTELIPSYHQLLHRKAAYLTSVGDQTNTHKLGGAITCITHPMQIWRRSEYLEKVVGLAERGVVRIEIQEVLRDALDEENEGWNRAVELIESKRVRGKVVLEIC